LSEQRNKEELSIRYLLGGLSEKERTTIEERFFADDQEFEELEIAEGELIDRYVRKELSATDQLQFEEVLSTSPRLIERVEFARILASRITSPVSQQDNPEPVPVPDPVAKPKKDKDKKRWWQNFFGPTPEISPVMRVALVAPLALLLLMSIALVFVWQRLQTQSGRLAAEQQRLQQLQKEIDEQKFNSGRLEDALNQTNQEREAQDKLLAEYQQQLEVLQRQSPASIFSFLLYPGGGTRGGGSSEKTILIPPGAQHIELRLNVETGNYSIYQASLQNIDRKPIGPQQRIKPFRRGQNKVIPFKVAARLLPPGSYYVHVDGLTPSGEAEDFNDYPFRVTSR